ncbi:MAG: hypothetical protein ABJM12_00845, partial [Ekhidna sp.]
MSAICLLREGVRMKSLAQFTFVTDSGHEVAAHRWKNPDGSVGGWVAETATIGKDSIVEIDAIVFPDA